MLQLYFSTTSTSDQDTAWLTFDDLNNEETFDMEQFRGCYAIGGADLLPDPAAEAAFTAVENREFDWQLSAGLKAAIATLPAKEREAVTLHRLNGCMLSQARQKIGLSVERVRQLDKRALRLLRLSTAGAASALLC